MGNLKISVLDVGHGDFIFAQSPNGENLVIDCGPGDGPASPGELLSNLTTIHELQVSHPHTDHFGDLSAFKKKNILSFRCTSQLAKFDDDVIGWKKKDEKAIELLRSWSTTKRPNDGAVPSGRNGFEHWVWGPVSIDYNDPNTASMVTLLRYNDFKILLCGDLPADRMDLLLCNQNFVNVVKGTTILKAAHHGRDNGCCEALFDVISPVLTVISDKSVDKSNENTVATDWYRDRSKGGLTWSDGVDHKVLTTRSDGSIHFQATGSAWHVWTGKTWDDDWTP